MKKSMIFAYTTLLLFSGLMTRTVWSAPQTVSGVISDSMCGKKHMMPGKSDAECVRECVKAGSKYILVVGDRLYTLNANPQTIAPFAGKQVQVQGEIKGSTLSVQSIHESLESSHR
jgi:hypothetical protein